MATRLSRRGFLTSVATAAGALTLSGCNGYLDGLSEQGSGFRNFLANAEDLTRTTQRFFVRPSSMAREFSEADIAPNFRANGSTNPDSPEYQAMVANNFSTWKLKISGLVENPMEFSLADLRAMPSRTQITRHDCVE